MIERAKRRAYSLREDGRGFDAKLIEELIEVASMYEGLCK